MGTVRVCFATPPGGLIQWLAGAVTFLVQVALALHHADEVGERLLLVDRDVPEVAAHRLRTREQKWLFVFVASLWPCDKPELLSWVSPAFALRQLDPRDSELRKKRLLMDRRILVFAKRSGY